MQELVILKKGQKVKVLETGGNASDFTIEAGLHDSGIYNIDFWKNIEFEIEGTIKTFENDFLPDIHCAYLLNYNGKNIGYVYNTFITPIKEKPTPEYTMEQLKNIVGHDFKIKVN